MLLSIVDPVGAGEANATVAAAASVADRENADVHHRHLAVDRGSTTHDHEDASVDRGKPGVD